MLMTSSKINKGLKAASAFFKLQFLADNNTKLNSGRFGSKVDTISTKIGGRSNFILCLKEGLGGAAPRNVLRTLRAGQEGAHGPDLVTLLLLP
jgi:hypothetical protein